MKLTVVQVLPSLESGGVERGALEVADELVRQGHRSILISDGGQLVSHLTDAGSEHVQWPLGEKSLLTLRWIPKLRRFLEACNADVLHARSRMPAWVAYLAWRGMKPDRRPRFVTTVHGLYSVNAYSAVMTRGEVVIAVSDTARRYIEQNYLDTEVAATRIRTIYRGVDPEMFPYEYRPADAWFRRWFARYPMLRDRHVLTLPGRLTRLKGHEDFIELLSRLSARGLPVHGLIVGGQDPRRLAYARQLHSEIRARGLEDRITFTGYRTDMRDIYAASRIVLSLSRKPESFGRTVLEALSLGVPVIGYDHGGVGEILEKIFPDGRAPLGDLDMLETRAAALLDRQARVAQSSPFPLQRMLDKTLTLYNELSAHKQS